MRLPPQSDPERPVVAATRGTLLVACILAIVGLFPLYGLVEEVWLFQRLPRAEEALPLLSPFMLGMLHLMCFFGLRGRHVWAINLSAVLAIIELFPLLIMLFILCDNLSQYADEFRKQILMIVSMAAFITALFILIVYLYRSYEPVRASAPRRRGFEPILMPPTTE